MTQQWSIIESHMILSGGGLTLTGDGTSDFGSAFGGVGLTPGPGSNALGYYFEMTWTHGSADGRSGSGGVGNVNSTAPNNVQAGSTADVIVYRFDGSIINGGSTLAAGDVWNVSSSGYVSFCIDAVNWLFWGKPQNGNWNGNASYNPANPGGGGGITIPSTVYAANIVPSGGLITYNSDSLTARFQSASWAGTPPAGFGVFDSAVTTPAMPYIPGRRRGGIVLRRKYYVRTG